MVLAFSQWALELGSYAGLEGVSAVVISALSLRSHEGLFPGLPQGFILLDAGWMNLDGSWQIAGQNAHQRSRGCPGLGSSKGLQVKQGQASER